MSSVPASRPVLAIGARGPLVRALQVALRRQGASVAADGSFGPQTRRGVAVVQARLGLPATGVADRRLLGRLRLGLDPRAARRPPATGSSLVPVFPVAAEHRFSDDWGAPRAQGRHEGTDILAARGAPVVAVADAVVHRLTRTETGLGGIYIWLRRDDGTEYYYAHLQSITAGLEAGVLVRAGQVIGSNGNTGDARYGMTHVHFEIHPHGGAPVNPFPHLVAADARGGS